MEKRRLIPYSVHLREDIYDELKLAAGERKAAGLVRDAITMIIEGDDAYTSGYNKGLQTANDIILEDKLATKVVVNGINIGNVLMHQISQEMQRKKKK
jgi:hypothetical protein